MPCRNLSQPIVHSWTVWTSKDTHVYHFSYDWNTTPVMLKDTFNRIPFLCTEFSPWSAVWEQISHMQWFIQTAVYAPTSQSYMPVLKYTTMQKHIKYTASCIYVQTSASGCQQGLPSERRKTTETGICCDYHPWVKGAHPLVWYAPKQPHVCSAGMGCAKDGKCKRLSCPS